MNKGDIIRETIILEEKAIELSSKIAEAMREVNKLKDVQWMELLDFIIEGYAAKSLYEEACKIAREHIGQEGLCPDSVVENIFKICREKVNTLIRAELYISDYLDSKKREQG